MKDLLLASLLNLLLVFTTQSQEIPIPEQYTIVDTVIGDLDKDNIKELVVAYNIDSVDHLIDVKRELIIYKQTNNNWVVWKKSRQALYSSRGGGMMGDPYEEMKIEHGVLMISESGGSSWKWGFTNKYRYQEGAFYLIGYTGHGGKLCEFWRQVDFNLSTGKMIVTKEYEDCDADIDNPKIYKRENETVFEKDLKITLEKREEKEIKLMTPQYKHQIYLAIGQN